MLKLDSLSTRHDYKVDKLEIEKDRAFVLFVLSLFFGMIMLIAYGHDAGSFFYRIRSVMAIISVLFYVNSNIIIAKKFPLSDIKQIFLINGCLLICAIILFIDLLFHLTEAGVSDFVSRGVVILGLLLIDSIQLIVLNENNEALYSITGFRSFMLDHFVLCVILVSIIIYLLLTYNKTCPMWDEAILYKASSFYNGFSLFSISNSCFWGHISYSYTAIVAIFMCIFNNIDIVLFLVFSLTFIISICCFYGTLKIMVPQKKDIVYSVSSAVYALSPFTLGMIHNPYLDLFAIFVFTIFVYLFFAHKYYYAIVLMVIFLFIKEPSIIELGSFMLGVLIFELVKNGHKTWKIKLKVLFNKKNMTALLFAGIWIYFFVFVGNWHSSDGSILTDGTVWTISYFIQKCKTIFILNFNWLLLTISFVLVIYAFISERNLLEYLIPLGLVYSSMFFFLVVYPAHNHPRYLGAMIVPLYLVACAGLCILSERIIGCFIMYIVVALIFCSSFKTIDPITRISFQMINVGTDNMIMTDDKLSDSIVYNSQYEGYQKALNMAIKSIITSNPDSVICIPATNGNIWYYDALGEWKETDKSIEIIEYFDASKLLRYSDYRVNTTPIRITFVTPNADFGAISLGRETHLLYMPYIGKDEAEEVYMQCCVEKEYEYNSHGWILHDLVFYNE